MKVEYADEITEEQVRQIDRLLRDEFRTGCWEVVEEE